MKLVSFSLLLFFAIDLAFAKDYNPKNFHRLNLGKKIGTLVFDLNKSINSFSFAKDSSQPNCYNMFSNQVHIHGTVQGTGLLHGFVDEGGTALDETESRIPSDQGISGQSQLCITNLSDSFIEVKYLLKVKMSAKASVTEGESVSLNREIIFKLIKTENGLYRASEGDHTLLAEFFKDNLIEILRVGSLNEATVKNPRLNIYMGALRDQVLWSSPMVFEFSEDKIEMKPVEIHIKATIGVNLEV